MKRWTVRRRWRLYTKDNAPAEGTTVDLVGWRVCCLLGSAGIGKTFELKLLEELERVYGYEVRYVRLGEVASSPDRLTTYLASLAERLTSRSAVYLDAVDEAMVPVATTSQILADWIQRGLERARP